MPPTARSGQAMVNAYLAHLNITPADATDDQRASALAELIDGYREMLRGVFLDEGGRRRHHLWSFMHPTSATLTVSAMANASLTHLDIVFTAVDTGADGQDVTVTVAAGSGALDVAESGDDITITLASGGNTTAEVVAACSGLTVATVTGGSATSATALAETHLTLAVAGTACPSGFGGLAEAPRYGYDAQEALSGLYIKKISPEEMDVKIRDWDGEAQDPEFFCLRPKAQSATTGSTLELVFFPPPEEDRTVYLRNRVDPGDLTDSASSYPVGNMGCEQLILALTKANKELEAGQEEGPQRRRAMRLFADLVEEDEALFPVETIQQSLGEEDCGLGA